jgi:ketosteroid isomerase-like protein
MATARRSSTRLRYQFDEANRLTVRGRLRPVRVVEGRVTTDPQNRLVYRVDDASRAGDPDAPHALTLDGDWSLTDEHGLALTLRERSGAGRQRLYLNGALTGAEANALIVTLARGTSAADAEDSQRVVLSGRWRADVRNRLAFLVQKADGSEDRLTLQGGWELDEHHQLVYRYRRLAVDRRAESHTVVFDGAWDIPGASRLVYRLAGSSASAFEFRASLRTRSLMAAEGRLVYEVGLGLTRGPRRQQVSLFGTWKLNRDLSVTFEVPYAGGRVQTIRFEGTYSLSPRDRISVALKNSRRQSLGISVAFTRELIADASLFLRLRKYAEETSAIGGVQVQF